MQKTLQDYISPTRKKEQFSKPFTLSDTTDYEKGYSMYAEGKRLVEQAKGYPKQKEIIIAKGTAMIINGAKLANPKKETK